PPGPAADDGPGRDRVADRRPPPRTPIGPPGGVGGREELLARRPPSAPPSGGGRRGIGGARIEGPDPTRTDEPRVGGRRVRVQAHPDPGDRVRDAAPRGAQGAPWGDRSLRRRGVRGAESEPGLGPRPSLARGGGARSIAAVPDHGGRARPRAACVPTRAPPLR